MSFYGWRDCPDEIKAQVERLMLGFRDIARENLTGLYLHGSLAMGCFNPRRSDLDLLAVTASDLPQESRLPLASFLLENSRRPAPVEISFLRQSDFHPWRYPTPFDFHYSETWREFFVLSLENNRFPASDSPHLDTDLAAHITVTRQRGIRLFGLPIIEIFPPVPEKDFIDSLWQDTLSDEFGLTAETDKPVYVILNACRTLAYLHTRQVLSKAEGGEWAIQTLPSPFRPLIRQALDIYQGEEPDEDLSRSASAQFVDFMRAKFDRYTPDPGGIDADKD
jgi:streptomycin 3"-adenylyltransferase